MNKGELSLTNLSLAELQETYGGVVITAGLVVAVTGVAIAGVALGVLIGDHILPHY